LPTKDI